jgi:hypothetical protein
MSLEPFVRHQEILVCPYILLNIPGVFRNILKHTWDYSHNISGHSRMYMESFCKILGCSEIHMELFCNTSGHSRIYVTLFYKTPGGPGISLDVTENIPEDIRISHVVYETIPYILEHTWNHSIRHQDVLECQHIS